MNTEIIPAFPKIFQLGDLRCKNIFDNEIEITEKIDGSQFSFGLINGKLQYRSKGTTNEQVDRGMFGIAIDYAESVKSDLLDNVVYHGEFLKTHTHNTLSYDRVPQNNFILFAMRYLEDSSCANHSDLTDWADGLNCDVVPLLYQGESNHNDDEVMVIINEYLSRDSFLGGCKIEGIVIKNYHIKSEYGGKEMPLLAGKYVSEAFKEKHSSNPEYHGQTLKLKRIGEQLKTPARWTKAIHMMRDEGTLTNSVKDIGPLMKIVNTDLIDEETDWIKEELWKAFNKDIRKFAHGGLPEWYKKYLIDENFKGEVSI